jgi:hypothetical protein
MNCKKRAPVTNLKLLLHTTWNACLSESYSDTPQLPALLRRPLDVRTTVYGKAHNQISSASDSVCRAHNDSLDRVAAGVSGVRLRNEKGVVLVLRGAKLGVEVKCSLKKPLR